MYGRQARMPIDTMYGTPTPKPQLASECAGKLRESLEAAYERVRKQIGQKLDRPAEIYNRKAHGEPFKPGDLVWLHSPAIAKGHSKKLHKPWTGPFKIVSKLHLQDPAHSCTPPSTGSVL